MSSSLSSNQLEKLKREIRECSERREQSLNQLKEWIIKHPFISNFNMDETILLAFIRARKYRMDRVFESIDKSSILMKVHNEWFDYKSEKLQRVLDLYDTGFLKVMKQRDNEGRRILHCNNNLDIEKFNIDDIYRLNTMIVNILSLEEETQISGIIYINDYRVNNSMKYFTMFPLKPLSDFIAQLKFIPIRAKKIILLGLPSYATQFLNIVKKGISEKMSKRIEFMDDTSQLWNIVDKSTMTKDIDGEANEREIIEDFRKKIDENIERIQTFLNFNVDLEKAGFFSLEDLENIGTFRKLQID
ncbi:hypothetical protein PVAND_000098 [Polypedilum vanderplanki]|uniref:CRAL-TRIO domain-containing protein n=1 Tax=Polypedilum vanderplanki TaxID=319348 RepID=A0A9J6BJ12_POLVA|nr:hypothetical protein PVAND_000098 [Polypedilum vanderplanki]